jgi:acetyl esterase/lipase
MRDDLKITVHKWTAEEQQAVNGFYEAFRKVWDTMNPWYKLEEPFSEAGVQRFRDAMKYGRDGWPVPKRLDDVAVNIAVPSSSGNDGLYLRVIKPTAPSKGVYLHMHSGGWTVGSADIEDTVLHRIAKNTGYTVASVEYRLAPKHRYPKAIDDCLDAALFLLHPDNENKYGPLRIIGGESAGGHLTMAVAFRLRNKGIDVRKQFHCLVFNYGVFGMSKLEILGCSASSLPFIPLLPGSVPGRPECED